MTPAKVKTSLPDLAATVEHFELPDDGLLLVRVDGPLSMEVAEHVRGQVVDVIPEDRRDRVRVAVLLDGVELESLSEAALGGMGLTVDGGELSRSATRLLAEVDRLPAEQADAIAEHREALHRALGHED